MIARRVCVSCKNREYEVVRGRNAKNTAPTLVLDPRRLAVAYGEPDQRIAEVRDPLTVDALELAVQLLGSVSGRLAFSRARGGPSMTTLELAKSLAPARPKRGLGGTIVHARRRPSKSATIDKTPNEQRDALDGGEAPVSELAMGVTAL
jgi:hypothetical protein